MNCDDFLELVTSGGKGLEDRPEFIEHVKGCARCREDASALLAAARAIRAAPVEALAGHPASHQVVALALDPEASALDVNRRVAEHVAVCPTCTSELQEVRRAEQKRRSHEQGGVRALSRTLGNALVGLTRGPMPARVALATSLGFLLLVYPAFLGLRQLPRVKQQVEDLEVRANQRESQIRDLPASPPPADEPSSRLSQWTGPVRLFALSSPVRGQGSKQKMSVSPADPYVLLSVRPILAEPSADADVYRVTITGRDGRVAWTSEMMVEEMRQQMRSSGALIFPIPSSVLSRGEYELRVLAAKEPREPILQIPFEVVPNG